MVYNSSPIEIRKMISEKKITSQTSGMCLGYAQGNIVILPKNMAFDFLLFAHRNPKTCPLLEVVEGGKLLKQSANGELITEVLPKYRVYKNGELEGEYTSIDHLWEDDFVTFVIGCSFTFESALLEEGIPMRHIETGKNVAMYQSSIACQSAGIFKGEMVVSMRPIKVSDVDKVIEITSHYPSVHGTPIHIGAPEVIGITDISKPDYGDAVEIKEDEVPVFWACGVTPQGIAVSIKPRIMITHAPGHMLITDIENSSLME